MRWPKRRSDPEQAPTAGQREADKALDEAEKKLKRTEGSTREILVVTEHLRRLGERNDFAQKIKEALGGAG